MKVKKTVNIILGMFSLILVTGATLSNTFWPILLVCAIYLNTLVLLINEVFEKKVAVVAPVHETVVKAPVVEPPVPEIKQPVKFLCPECQKEFENEKKMRRHYGMAHYDKMVI